jgi:hypothetical protein
VTNIVYNARSKRTSSPREDVTLSDREDDIAAVERCSELREDVASGMGGTRAVG